MVLDQRPFGVGDRLLYGGELLGDVEAWPAVLDHGDDALQMAFRAPKTLDDLWMGGMRVRFGHRVHFQNRLRRLRRAARRYAVGAAMGKVNGGALPALPSGTAGPLSARLRPTSKPLRTRAALLEPRWISERGDPCPKATATAFR